MFCAKCETGNNETSKFCSDCGSPLASNGVVPFLPDNQGMVDVVIPKLQDERKKYETAKLLVDLQKISWEEAKQLVDTAPVLLWAVNATRSHEIKGQFASIGIDVMVKPHQENLQQAVNSNKSATQGNPLDTQTIVQALRQKQEEDALLATGGGFLLLFSIGAGFWFGWIAGVGIFLFGLWKLANWKSKKCCGVDLEGSLFSKDVESCFRFPFFCAGAILSLIVSIAFWMFRDMLMGIEWSIWFFVGCTILLTAYACKEWLAKDKGR